ncbi:MAG: translation initiation factor IF-2, partial [Desulfofustis sp.]|nr:translation initiation factor IF-2 [Desulfofustis sp.]
MSRVRVYELAKEAGMTGKDLAGKLIAEGYDVKGHSSTVDEDTAEKIRRTMLQDSETELVEKRIDGSQGATVIRRRATIIRRRPKAEQEETAEEAAEIEGSTQEAGEDLEQVSVQDEVESAPVAEPDVEQHETEADEQSDVVPPVVADAGQDAELIQESEDLPEGETAEEGATEVDQPADQEAAKIVKKPKKVERKSIARVVGSISLPIADETESAERPRPKKIVRSTASKTGRPNIAVQFQEETPSEASERARKKGKRTPGADDDDRDRRGKGVRKGGKKSVKFTHFDADYQRGGKRGKRGRKVDKRIAPSTIEMKASKRKITVFDTITVGDLASRMKIKASEVIAKLMGLGVMATMNQAVDIETATLIATDFGYEIEQGITEEIGIQLLDAQEEGGETRLRPPVVTVMGHVDHGKTSILDAIRKTDVAEGEAGGITQHIGAYHVRSKAGDVTFVDTPGHAAFTEMRSRGAQITDLVILVVAADDGVMDQTKEAINHAQAANVPILVAVNKIDKDNADPDRVKRELSDFGLIPEDWGGQTIYCETSAKKNIGIDELLENIQLMSEMLELKADASRKAKGRVIEAQLDKGRGAVATVLIQDGTLRNGDYFVVGQHSGKVRAMRDDKGRPIKEAGPSSPVEVQGLSGVPQAGDEFIVVTDEKMAKSVSQARSMKVRETELAAGSKISLDKLFEKMAEGDVQELRVIIRADVQGTLEAFAKAAEELSTE